MCAYTTSCHVAIAVFLDATGSVVRKLRNCKRILYYELSVRNPIGSGCSISVAAMLSSDHTVTAVSHFLQSFRDAEKRIFGFRSVVNPVVAKVDFCMTLIMSLLVVFNKQDLHDYLTWSWETLHQSTEHTTCIRTIIHICLAHFMKCIKGLCVRFCKSNTGVCVTLLHSDTRLRW